MILKYQAKMDEVDNCPPASVSAVERDAYRFVHAEMGHKNNALPTALIEPEIYPPGHEMHCHSWALSLFSSKEAAERKFRTSIRARPLLLQRVGGHIAVGTIRPRDGLATAPAKNSGHFSLFESEEFDFVSTFEMIGTVDGVDG